DDDGMRKGHGGLPQHSSVIKQTRPASPAGLVKILFHGWSRLALAGLEALVHLVDDVNAAATADELIRAVASHQRLQRVADLQPLSPRSDTRGAKAPKNWPLHRERDYVCQRAIPAHPAEKYSLAQG